MDEGMHVLGVKMPSSDAVAAARTLLNSAPTATGHPFSVALWFFSLPRSQISRTGSGHGAQIPGDPLLIALFDEACPGQRDKPGDETPWCAAFLKWCAARSGVPLDITASSQSIAKSKTLVRVADSKLGDFVQFVDVHNGADTNTGHAAMYVAALPRRNGTPQRILTLGGNQTDADGAWSIVSVAPQDVHFEGEANIHRRLVGYFHDSRWAQS